MNLLINLIKWTVQAGSPEITHFAVVTPPGFEPQWKHQLNVFKLRIIIGFFKGPDVHFSKIIKSEFFLN